MEVTMGDVVDLHGQSLIENHEFVSDCARYGEGLLDKKFLKAKYRFDDSTWERLGSDDALVEAIEFEKIRRMRNGDSAREKAQQLFVAAPGVLGGILKRWRRITATPHRGKQRAAHDCGGWTGSCASSGSVHNHHQPGGRCC
jgi:hypothetical protein